MTAAHAVCQAVTTHAQACLDDPTNVPRIVAAGNGLVQAVLNYEARLGADTGWSYPARHLGRLPVYNGNGVDAVKENEAESGVRIKVGANYLVEVTDEELLAHLVEGRGGDRPASVVAGVRFLFESDSWDVWQYPPNSLRPVEADCEIELTGDSGTTGSP